MKFIMYFGSGLVMAAAAMAQGNNLSECGRICIQNMQGQATALGCTAGDNACLCRNPNFTYGIRDCSYQSCPGAAQAEQGVAAGVEICRAAGVVVATTPEATVVKPTGTATVIVPPVVSTIFSVITSDGKTITTAIGHTTIAPVDNANGGTPVSSAVSTSTFTTVVTNGGSTFTTTGETTLFGIGGVPGGASLPHQTQVTTVPVVSTITTGDSVITSTIGSTTILAGPDPTSVQPSQEADVSSHTETHQTTQSRTGQATSASSTGHAPKQTAGPAAGILAAAGLAAMLM
ncbi:uncharacterized protein CTRU02_203608 [Colletotrichum truncatum]|uniref:Uncharacterized protein n=1 Tax=Colletotrichum truncatum TaxID=5467 RepID=A0ACC3ZA06_COLTU|nr:uncharacterized protein CTRU02_03942 [Colletotrichum truncatum]KAF6795982.1 hypothetical protein CTRU02_03942 [Colletotrichum truncatum]